MKLEEAISARPELRRAFEAVTAAGAHYDGVYLVGGTVRDILLGEPNFDVDIAIEGDAIPLAGELAEALGGRVRSHPKFGTAVVSYGDGERVDVATTRTEHYEKPAALPAVEPASIQDDLQRRDFTVNAMAMSLKDDDFGRLVDPFDGQSDLSARTLRVLHDHSFIEDPTRIFRGIRYESRYDFRMDDHTLQLARESIELGHVGDLSPARLRDELEALLEEGDSAHSIVRLGELGADKAVHPLLAADEEAAQLFARLKELKGRSALDLPGWRLGLAALARKVPAGEAQEWLAGLKLRRGDAEQVANAVAFSGRIVEELSGAEEPSPAEVVDLADPYGPDAPLLALALSDLEPLHAYFQRLRGVELEIGGRDIAELGLQESPRVGEVLAAVKRRKLNGEVDGRESELAAARELIEEAK